MLIYYFLYILKNKSQTLFEKKYIKHMITNEKIKGIKESIDKTVKDNFLRDKQIEPMIIILANIEEEEKQVVIPLGEAFKNLDKNSISLIIKEIIKTVDVIYLSFIMKGWSADGELDDMSISKIDYNKEILIVTHETKHTCELHAFDIIRDKQDNIVMSEPIILNEYKGRFCDFLGGSPTLN
jgi:hypothetical protein